MANSYDSSLITAMLAEGFITVAQNRLAPLNFFSREFGTDPMKPLAVVKIAKATAGASAQTNPTSFGGGNSTVGVISATVAHIHQPLHVSHADLNNGLRLQKLIGVAVGSFCDAIVDAAFTPITVANYTNTAIVAAAASFDTDDLRTAYGSIKKAPEKYAVLDGEYFAQLLMGDKFAIGPNSGLVGFNGFAEHTRWTGAGANVRGFVCGADALGVCSGMPLVNPGAEKVAEVGTIALPQLGLTVQTWIWFDPATRNLNASYDVMFGAAAGDVSVLTLIKSA